MVAPTQTGAREPLRLDCVRGLLDRIAPAQVFSLIGHLLTRSQVERPGLRCPLGACRTNWGDAAYLAPLTKMMAASADSKPKYPPPKTTIRTSPTATDEGSRGPTLYKHCIDGARG